MAAASPLVAVGIEFLPTTTHSFLKSGLRISFSALVLPASGTITLRSTDGRTSESFDIANSSRVYFNGTSFTVDPTLDLVSGTTYEIEILYGRVRAAGGNVFGGDVFRFSAGASDGADLQGTWLPDLLQGGDGSDRLHGGKGNDTLRGAGGYNTVVLVGDRADYDIRVDPKSHRYTITDKVPGRDGVDTAYEIQAFEFKDVTLAVGQVVDLVAPALQDIALVDDSGRLTPKAHLAVRFDEDLQRGSGELQLSSTDGKWVERYDAATSSRLTLSGKVLTLDPSLDLTPGLTYMLSVPVGTVTDRSGNGSNQSRSFYFAIASDSGQTLTGASSLDHLYGGNGNDTLNGGKGDDLLEGGLGTDTATYSGKFSDYSVSFDAATGNYRVADKRGSDGTDTLHGVEYLRFSDARVTVDGANVPELTIVSAYPRGGSTGFVIDDNLRLTMSGPVKLGTGTITLALADGKTVERYDVATSTRIKIEGATLVIDPAGYLREASDYVLTMPAGSLLDLNGLPWPGGATLGFRTQQAGRDIYGTNSGDDIRSSDGNDKLHAGKGNDTLYGNGGNDSLLGEQDTDTAVFAGAAGEYTIRYDAQSRVYRVIDSVPGRDGIDELRDVEYARFSDKTLTVADFYDVTSPRVIGLDPADEARQVLAGTDIRITFSEPIQRGQGNILLKLSNGTVVESFRADSSPQLSINGATLTINPSKDLLPGTAYMVTLDSASIDDLSRNSYLGGNALYYNFTTANPGLTMVGTSGHDTLTGGDGDDSFNGGDGNDRMVGGKGNDLFDASDTKRGSGADRMEGGTGNDYFTVDDYADQVVEWPGEGSDAVSVPFDYSLVELPNVEHLYGRGTTGLRLAGNDLGNSIIGTTGPDMLSGALGDDWLTGAGGNDQIDGGGGNDTAMFSGNFAEYTIRYDPFTERFTVTDSVPGRDAVDALTNLEFINFKDGLRHLSLLKTTAGAPAMDEAVALVGLPDSGGGDGL